jgi:2-polyprenyl-6-hydroxyphenyl methylase/3-demethylubiquinone-9 3-methyltransferase
VRNDLRQYDELADQWWDPRGHFVSLSWIARSRAKLVPTASRAGAVLVDVACGGGLLAPHIADKGYVHIGVDLSEEGPKVARAHGVDHTVRGDIHHIPLADESADVVVAGQCLEHVADPFAVVRECCRILKPGGTFVLDTIADTLLARLCIITLGENLPLPGMAPKGCHDHRFFVNPDRLAHAAAAAGVPMKLRGLFPNSLDFVKWILKLRPEVRMTPVRSTSVLYQAVGVKTGASPETGAVGAGSPAEQLDRCSR